MQTFANLQIGGEHACMTAAQAVATGGYTGFKNKKSFQTGEA